MRFPLRRLITVLALVLLSPIASNAADTSKECPVTGCASHARCAKQTSSDCASASAATKDSCPRNALLAPCAMQKALASFCETCEQDADLATCTKSCGIVETAQCDDCDDECTGSRESFVTGVMPLTSLCSQVVQNLIMAGTVWMMHSPHEIEVDFAWNTTTDLEESEMLAFQNVDLYMIRRGNEITLEFGAPGGYSILSIDQEVAQAMQELAETPLGAGDVMQVTLENGELVTVARLQVIDIPNAQPREPARLEICQEQCEVSPSLAAVQNLYGDLCEQGCDKEAEELIDQILAQKSLGTEKKIVRDAVHYEWKGAGTSPKHHQVGYQPAEIPERYPLASDGALRQVGFNASDWNLASEGKVSFHFQGASLAEVADFFRHATGREVVVETPNRGSYYAPAGIHVLCRDKTVSQSLRVVLGSCGLGYAVLDEVLVIGEPAQIEALRSQSQDCWTP